MGRSHRDDDRMESRDRHRKERSPKKERNEKSDREDWDRRERRENRHGSRSPRESERSRSPHGRQQQREGDEDVKPRIKQERVDRGYARHDHRHHDDVSIKQERDTRPVMNIRQERDMNDRRRIERRRHQPENPFEGMAAPTEEEAGGSEAPKEKEKPSFEKSGALTEDTNTYRGVVIKYNEPKEARKPKRRWRFYIFKGEEQLPVLHVHRQSAYLLGRDRKIADIPIDHPSCSKQHAVLQYRLAEFTREDGTTGRRVRPYVIDLESANGTFLNNNKIEPRRYYELQEKDVVKFGFSSRDYVLLHANSKDDEDEV